MEIKPGEPCLLWENTKAVAEDRGFTLSNECPLIETCGTSCRILDGRLTDEDERKLAALRQELKSLG